MSGQGEEWTLPASDSCPKEEGNETRQKKRAGVLQGSDPSSCPYSPNLSPSCSSVRLSSSACSKAALASALALVAA
jgi:hypothetical protein